MAVTTSETEGPYGITIQITATLSVSAEVARRMVNVELMMKVGQLVITGEPSLMVDGDCVFWKVPLFVAAPSDDRNTYPLELFALVDAISGLYVMELEFAEKITKESIPIVRRIYPQTPKWEE